MKTYSSSAPMSEAAKRILADPEGRQALSNWIQNGMARPELITIGSTTYEVSGSVKTIRKPQPVGEKQ